MKKSFHIETERFILRGECGARGRELTYIGASVMDKKSHEMLGTLTLRMLHDWRLDISGVRLENVDAMRSVAAMLLDNCEAIAEEIIDEK